MTTRRWLMVALGRRRGPAARSAAALAGVYADYLWYDALGARRAVARAHGTRSRAAHRLRRSPPALFAFVNLYAVRQSVVSLVLPRRLGNLEIGEEVPGRYLHGRRGRCSRSSSACCSPCRRSDWTIVRCCARIGQPFGETDPYFSADLGFFVYWLPFENALWTAGRSSCVLVVIGRRHPALRADAEPQWQRGSLYVVDVRAPALHGARRRAAAAARVELSPRHVSAARRGQRARTARSAGSIITSTCRRPGARARDARRGADRALGRLRPVSCASPFVAVIAVLLALARRAQVAPLVARRSADPRPRRTRSERPYHGHARRLHATRVRRRPHARATRLGTAFTSTSDSPRCRRCRLGSAARSRARSSASDTCDVDRHRLRGWTAAPSGLVADVVERAADGSGGDARDVWTDRALRRRRRGRARRAVCALAGRRRRRRRRRSTSRSCSPGARGYARHRRFADAHRRRRRSSQHAVAPRARVVAAELPPALRTICRSRTRRSSRTATFATASQRSRRSSRRAARSSPSSSATRCTGRVDLYSRVRRLSAQPHVHDRSTDERSYFQHAAVGDRSGVDRRRHASSPTRRSIRSRRRWVHRLPSLFTTWTALPAGIRALLAAADRRPRTRRRSPSAATGRAADRRRPRHIPTLDGADTSARRRRAADRAAAAAASTAVALPLVDDSDRLRGLIDRHRRRDARHVLVSAAPRRARAGAPCSIACARSTARAARARDGPARARPRARRPVRSGIAFVQPTYRWRAQSAPTLDRVALSSSATRARSVAPPLAGARLRARCATVPAPRRRSPTASASALYAAMRDALRRGDWVAFGRAFDALGARRSTPEKPVT